MSAADARRTPAIPLILGPTGAGKTDLALRLAEQHQLEIVSVDSAMVYRGMDIGTGKPTAGERAALPHHVIDVVDPAERYHAARFRRDALEAIAGIRARGRLPVVVGGTGLYVRALLKGLHPAPPADPADRGELEAFAAAQGSEALHQRLAERDPAAAARLHPRDRVRLVRALEVLTLGGPGSEPADWGSAVPPFRLLMVGLRQSREALGRRIADRVRAMVARGMLSEVKGLLEAGYDEALPAMGGIGYRQFCAVLRGDMTEAEATRLMIRDTTRYAKRQMTWFARDPEVRWLDVDAVGGLDGAARAVQTLATEEGVTE